MSTKITQITNVHLQEIAKRADKNNDGKLKKDEYSLFAKEAQAQDVDYKEIYEALEMNGFQRWWYDVDKISTDGEDDGKLSFKEGATSFVKGLVGGIPKAMVKHPIASVVTIGACAGLVALTGGAILPALTAVGIATGVGMAGVGTYKAITAKTDGDAKQALETMGMGVTTTTLSALTAGKALEKAEMAGVKSAHVAEDANIFQKSVQAFKAIPESLKMSKNWAMSYIKGTPVNIELANGTKQVKVKGKLKEETLYDGTLREFNKNGLAKETLADGSLRKYDSETGYLVREKLADGTIREFNEGELTMVKFADGTYKKFRGSMLEEIGNTVTGDYKKYGYVHSRQGGYNITDWVINEEGNKYTGNYKVYYEWDHDIYKNGAVIKRFVRNDSEMERVFMSLKNEFARINQECDVNLKIRGLNMSNEAMQALQTASDSYSDEIITSLCTKIQGGKQNLDLADIVEIADLLKLTTEQVINMDTETYISLCKQYNPANNPNNPLAEEIFEIIQNL